MMYDIRRDYDTINIARRDIIITALRDDEHPFWYARVLKAFHIKVSFPQDGLAHSEQTMEVLWVRWLGMDRDHQWGFKEARLPKVGFVPDHPDHAPFGFLNPSLVLCRCHIIPLFPDGRTHELLVPGPSLTRLPGEVDDWAAFYVNMYM